MQAAALLSGHQWTLRHVPLYFYYILSSHLIMLEKLILYLLKAPVLTSWKGIAFGKVAWLSLNLH